jgi:hypothetical protein
MKDFGIVERKLPKLHCVEYEGSELTFLFSYLKHVIWRFWIKSIFFKNKCSNMNINSINSEILFLPYVYGTCVNKKYASFRQGRKKLDYK